MNFWLFAGAANAFLAVTAGAFGAHVLEGRLSARELEIFSTGAHYHLIHALATVALALAPSSAASGRFRAACAIFTIGTVLFSGSLYVYAVKGYIWVVIATPIGGVCLLIGWALVAWGALAKK